MTLKQAKLLFEAEDKITQDILCTFVITYWADGSLNGTPMEELHETHGWSWKKCNNWVHKYRDLIQCMHDNLATLVSRGLRFWHEGPQEP